MTRPRRTAAYPALVGGAGALAALLAGCHGASSPTASGPTTGATGTTATATQPPPLTAATCRTLPHTGQRLGVTIPAGFSVEDHPAGADELAATYKVNQLIRARVAAPGAALPVVELTVYAYGPQEYKADLALQQSLMWANVQAGGSSAISAAARPTTIAGAQAVTGSDIDARSLNYNTPRPGDSTIRFWELTVKDTQYVLVLISRTPAQDQEYSRQLVAGLHPDGCP